MIFGWRKPTKRRSRRLPAAVAGFVLALLGLVVNAGPTAAGRAAAQTRVGPQPIKLILTVGVQTAAAPSIVGLHTLQLRPIASATGVAADSAAPMNSFMESGATISHSSTATAIGDDPNTLQNFARSRGAAGHDARLDDVDIPRWPQEYIQAAGSGDRMTIEIRRMKDEEYRQYVVGHRRIGGSGVAGESSVRIAWGEHEVRVAGHEVLNSQDAVEIFSAYYTLGIVPHSYGIRRIDL